MLGGETKSRGLISGQRSRGVVASWIAAAVVSGLLLLFFQFMGLIAAIILCGVVLVASMDIGTGSTPWSRMQDRKRMKYRRRMSIVDFIPVDDRSDDLPPKDPTWMSYRDWPDGVDGLNWLQSAPGQPAVAYHTPHGEEPYLSVTFSVDGPVQGLPGEAYVARTQESFGDILAAWGSSQRLVSGIQVVTRVLPADSASHEAWLLEQLDRDGAPMALQDDYLELSDELTAMSFVQRHFVVIRWNVNPGWHRVADRSGTGLVGWLDVITGALASVERRLVDAMYVNVQVMSGPRLAAVLRNQQHPSWPIDRASDVNVVAGDGLGGCWLPSHDEWSWTEVTSESPDPFFPDTRLPASSWFHRTARVPIDALEVRELDGMWMSPLLLGLEEPIIRTLAVHIQFSPARDAKVQARRDATQDQAAILSDEKKGRLIDGDAEMALSAANRRAGDLQNGSGHHGASWVAYLQVSAASTDDLQIACEVVTEAADQAGVNRLDWLDTLQAAAHATTWPLGRGIKPPKQSKTTRTFHVLAGGTAKEAIT